MTNNYLTYQRFSDIGLAEAIAETLKENKIDFLIEDSSKYFDISFANNSFASSINLKIKPEDFEEADRVLENLYTKHLSEVEKDYYLFGFSDEELQDILAKSDEWGHFDFQLAQKILKERGKQVSAEEIKLLKFRRIYELAEPESTNYTWIILAYIFSFVAGFFTILGGFAGVLIGWALISMKKTLPDGQIVRTYNEDIRKQGKFLILFSLAVIIFGYIVRFYYLSR